MPSITVFGSQNVFNKIDLNIKVESFRYIYTIK